MQVRGTYTLANRIRDFTLRNTFRIVPASPGSAASSSATASPTRVTGGHNPHRAPNFRPGIDEERGWTVPIGLGPARQLSRTPNPATIQPAPLPHKDPPLVQFQANFPLYSPSGTYLSEPSGVASGLAAGGGVVFASYNWGAAFSVNDGASWTHLDASQIFPNFTGCDCDQHVEYVPSIDRFIWVMLTSPVLVAAARPADIITSGGTSWTFWNITWAELGLPNTDSADFTYSSVGDNFLYVTFNDNNDPTGGGLEVMRLPLSGIQSGGTVNFRFTHPSDSPNARFSYPTENPGDSIFWAGFKTTSTITTYSWPENSIDYSWQDVNVWSCSTPTNVVNGGTSLATPDGRTWVPPTPSQVEGTTRVQGNFAGVQTDQLFFAWTAPAGCGFPQPQVQWVVLDHSNNLNVLTQQQLWNPNVAIAYPVLATNSNGEVGVSLAVGGGSAFENHAVGFLNDFWLFITTNSSVGVKRFGDFFSIRQNVADGTRFDAFGYGVNSTPQNGEQSDTCTNDNGTTFFPCIPDVHYIVFGRPPAPGGAHRQYPQRKGDSPLHP
jgi:hypothetical protein